MTAQCQMVSPEQGEEGSAVGSRKAYEVPETFSFRVAVKYKIFELRWYEAGIHLGIKTVTTGDW